MYRFRLIRTVGDDCRKFEITMRFDGAGWPRLPVTLARSLADAASCVDFTSMRRSPRRQASEDIGGSLHWHIVEMLTFGNLDAQPLVGQGAENSMVIKLTFSSSSPT